MPENALILIAEDREDDVVLMRRAFEKANVVNPLHFVRDGEEAIAYLRGEPPYANRDEFPLPDLLLLDLKMPKIDGFEVLEWMRDQPGLKALRVVVLTSSEEMGDVNRAYSLGANSFLVKPVQFHDFVDLTRTINGHWLWMSRAPESFRRPRKIKDE